MPADQLSPVESTATRSMVFTSGPMFGARGEAVGIRDGRIVAIGDRVDVEGVVGDDAERMDLGGWMLLRCDLEQATDLDAALALIRAYPADHPESEWILGGGWSYSWFPGGNPPASLLHEITDRRVMLGVADGHSAWVNTAALEMADIDSSTPDPPGGVIVRHADGVPEGTSHEGSNGPEGARRSRRQSLRHQGGAPRESRLSRFVGNHRMAACVGDRRRLPRRPGLQYPFASSRDAGARLAMASDWSVTTPHVLQQIEVAVKRVKPSMLGAEPFIPDQRLSLEQALSAATAGSAHVNFFDGDSGTIEVAKRADLVVLDGDPSRADRISDISVDPTIIGGEIAHRAHH